MRVLCVMSNLLWPGPLSRASGVLLTDRVAVHQTIKKVGGERKLGEKGERKSGEKVKKVGKWKQAGSWKRDCMTDLAGCRMDSERSCCWSEYKDDTLQRLLVINHGAEPNGNIDLYVNLTS